MNPKMLSNCISNMRSTGYKIYADDSGRIGCVSRDGRMMFRGFESLEAFLGYVAEVAL